jgi:hypothetical protein
MSKLPSLSIIDDSDFKKASRREKFSMVLKEPRLDAMLTNQEAEHWERVQAVFALCFKQFDQTKAIRVIRSHIAGAERYEVAKRLYDDMCEVYGPVQKRNKEMARAMLVQRLWSIGVRLEQKGALVEAAEVFEKAGKFEGLDKDEVKEFNPDDIILPVPIITNDPRFANAEDVEYETDEDEQTEAGIFP